VNELALFAGAGGGILGGHLLGWRTVCAVEWEAYPASVLCARQNDGLLENFPIWDDVQTFDGKPWRGIVDVVSGGFPCQDISAAGKGAGINGERSGMWKEMARIIGEVRPKFVFVENSPMLVRRGLGTVLADLSKMGFNAEWGIIGADQVGAHHQRKRQWIVAYANNSIGGGGNAGGSGAHKNAKKNGTYIPSSINPNLYEWLMGWPQGWTDLKPLETDKYRRWQQLHGIC
jgi:DNA (cytosine-5)-methyltransferase 1